MSEVNGGQLIARQLAAEGIDTVFAVVAGPMIGAIAALPREGIRVIGCRHEEQAGFMAQAWGYVTGKPGVVIVGSGPAMTNTITSLHVAQENGWPLVVLGGSSGLNSRYPTAMRGLGEFQEAAQVVLAAPACKWAIAVDSAARIPEFIHLALAKAVSGRPGAVYLDFPGRLINTRVSQEQAPLRLTRPAVHRPHADPAGIAAIAAMLAEAERPLILIGKGAASADAAAPLARLVDLGFPFLPSPMGRGTVPDDHPLCMGAARSAALRGADMVLMVGGRFNWIFQFGRPPSFAPGVRIAQIDLVAEEMTSGAEVEVGVVADAAAAVEQLCDALSGRPLRVSRSGWVEQLSDQVARSRADLEERMATDVVPINPYRVLREVRDAVARDATIVVDGEITLGVGRIVLPSYLPRHRLNAGTTACMGTGVPYAIGAKLARPGQQVVAVLGDYAFGASAMEIETAARIGAAVVFVIVNNEGIAGHQIQKRSFSPDDPAIATLLPARYDKMAEMVGGYAAHVEHPADLRPAITHALASKTVALINVAVDPNAGIREGMSSYLE